MRDPFPVSEIVCVLFCILSGGSGAVPFYNQNILGSSAPHASLFGFSRTTGGFFPTFVKISAGRCG